MSDRIVFDIDAEVTKYRAEVEKIPDITAKEARGASIRFGLELAKGQTAAAQHAKRAAAEAGSAWQGVADHIVGSLSSDAIMGAATSVYDYAAEVAAARTETIQLSRATGISLETLGAIGEAATRAGVDVDQITGGFEDFGEVLFDASQNGGRAQEALALLGVSSTDSAGRLRDTDTVMREVIDRFQSMESGAAKNAVAQQLFGDAGNKLNAVLGDTPFETWIAAAEQSGRVIDEDAVAATQRWNAAIGDLSSVINGFAQGTFDAFAGIMTGPIDNFTTGLLFLGEITRNTIAEMMDRLGQFAEAVKLAYSGDVVGYLERFGELITSAPADLAAIVSEAHAVAEAHANMRAELDGSGQAVEALSVDLGKLVDHSKEQAAAAREATKREQELARAHEQLAAIVKEATAAQLDEYGKIERTYSDRLEALVELSAESQELESEAAEASVALAEWRDYELAELADKQLEADREQIAEYHELYREDAKEFEKAQKDKRRALQQVGADAAAVAGAMAERWQDSLIEQVGDTKDQSKALRAERRELLEQLDAAESEAQARAIQRQLDYVQAQISSNDELNESRGKAIQRAAAVQKAAALIQVVVDSARAVMAAWALGPIVAGATLPLIAAAASLQTNIIMNEPLPEYYRGTADAPDEHRSMLHDGEFVGNAAAAERLGRSLVDAANRGQASSMPSGGGGTVYLDSYEVGRVLAHEARRPGPLRDVIRSTSGGRRRGLRSPY